ncbi:MAG: YfhO family protein [Tannerella sp.]|jgi:hypothetical protein|nr:YfhO family protein [Tannerella sp.]
MWNTLLKPLLPYFAAIGIFAVVSIAYFTPEIFQNQTMITVDGTGGMGAGKEALDFQMQTGKKTLWTNALFGGMPTYQISPGYPSTKTISYIQNISGLFLPYPANLIFMLLFGVFLLFLALGANPRIAIIGAIAYAFSSYFFILIHTGHIWKLLVLASIPPTFAGIIWAYRGKYLLGGAVAAIYASLQLVSNHPQMTYYFSILLSLFVISEFVICIKNKTTKRFINASGVLLLAGLIAFAINSTNIFHSWQYSKYTMRGPSELKINSTNQTSGIDRDYATNWSYGIEETFTLMIPDFKGGATGTIGNDEKALHNVPSQYRHDIAKTNRYWGNQPFTEGPVYVGAFIMFLFVYGLFIIKGRWKWILLAGTVLSILLSWGHNFMWLTDLFLDYFPIYDKFRAVSSILVVAELTIPMLAILTLIKVVSDPGIINKYKRELYISMALTAGLLLLFLIYPYCFKFLSESETDYFKEIIQENSRQSADFRLLMDDIEAVRIAISRSDAWRSLIIVLIGVGLIWLFYKYKIKSNLFLSLVAILVLFDLSLVNKRYLNKKDFHPQQQQGKVFKKTAIDNKILEDKSLSYRVYNLAVPNNNPFSDPTTSYYHKSIGGYHAAKIRRYQDLIEHHLIYMNPAVLNMLNTKYIITEKEGQPQLHKNAFALGNAWFVNNIRWVDSPDEEINALNEFDPLATAIIDKRFDSFISKNLENPHVENSSYIKMISYAPDHLVYESESSEDKLVVFSEIYYPHGWYAYIDGELSPHIRANYVLRTMPIPAGKHKIEFKFDPLSYHITETIAFIASGVLLLYIMLVLLFEFRKTYKKIRQNIHTY